MTSVPGTGRHWGFGTRPGSTRSKPSKKRRTLARPRGHAGAFDFSYAARTRRTTDLSGTKSMLTWVSAR
ncbi:MAG TPA: hypothetical protein VGG83_04825 [Trebonia sp.]